MSLKHPEEMRVLSAKNRPAQLLLGVQAVREAIEASARIGRLSVNLQMWTGEFKVYHHLLSEIVQALRDKGYKATTVQTTTMGPTLCVDWKVKGKYSLF